MLGELKRGGKNLNKISHDTAIGLINKVRSLGIKVKRVILDTVGQPEAYKIIIKKALGLDMVNPEIEVIVESKADFTYPVVSAASICAKVTRDSELKDYVFKEKKEFIREFGCGYPGDPKTKDWLL
jgi:ribonuclease H2 subunit A